MEISATRNTAHLYIYIYISLFRPRIYILLWFSSQFPRSTIQAPRNVPFAHIDPKEPADIAWRTENRRQKRQPVRSTSVMENIRGPWRGYPVRKILFRIASVCHCYVWRTDSSSTYPSCIMHPVIMQPLGVWREERAVVRQASDGERRGASVRFADSFCLFCNITACIDRRPLRYPARGSYIYLTHNLEARRIYLILRSRAIGETVSASIVFWLWNYIVPPRIDAARLGKSRCSEVYSVDRSSLQQINHSYLSGIIILQTVLKNAHFWVEFYGNRFYK